MTKRDTHPRRRLPRSVLRGIWLAYRPGRSGPDDIFAREFRDAFRLHSRSVVTKFMDFPSAVWALPINWADPHIAGGIHNCLAVKSRALTPSKEKATHAKLAHSLRAAAQVLTSSAVTDLSAAAALTIMAQDFGMPKTALSYPMLGPNQSEPKFSDFLRAMANLYEGDQGHVGGVHRETWQSNKVAGKGARGVPTALTMALAAATEAAARLDKFMRFHTSKPHAELVDEMVWVYHPDAYGKSFASTNRKRRSNGKPLQK